MGRQCWAVCVSNGRSYSDYRDEVLRVFLTESEAVDWCERGNGWLKENGFYDGSDQEWRWECDDSEPGKRLSKCPLGEFVRHECEYGVARLWVESVPLGYDEGV